MAESKPSPGAAPRACAERILAARDHGREELRRKLAKRGFEASEVAAVLDQLAEEGYLDDVRYAREFARQTLEKGHGSAYVRAKLASRGFRTAGRLVSAEEEAASLRAFLDRRRLRPGALTAAAERAKILRFLRGRGYSAEAIQRVLGQDDE
jgi:regulatory protein